MFFSRQRCHNAIHFPKEVYRSVFWANHALQRICGGFSLHAQDADAAPGWLGFEMWNQRRWWKHSGQIMASDQRNLTRSHHKYVLQDEQYKILESSSESAHTFSATYQVFIFAQTILFLWITCLNLFNHISGICPERLQLQSPVFSL